MSNITICIAYSKCCYAVNNAIHKEILFSRKYYFLLFVFIYDSIMLLVWVKNVRFVKICILYKCCILSYLPTSVCYHVKNWQYQLN